MSTEESVPATVAETVAPDSVETHEEPAPGIETKLDRIIEILETQKAVAVAESSPESGSGATEPNPGDVTEPANNETIRDESPASLPWTHKRIVRSR